MLQERTASLITRRRGAKGSGGLHMGQEHKGLHDYLRDGTSSTGR